MARATTTSSTSKPRAAVKQARTAQEDADRALEQASLKLQAAQGAYANDRETFGNWLATRKATASTRRDHDPLCGSSEPENSNSAGPVRTT